MENTYKAGDKLYFGYFTGAEIMIEDYEITNVYGNIIEVRNTNTGWFGKVHFSWLKDKNYVDTYEEALEMEKLIVNEEFIRRKDTYNAMVGGGSGLVPSCEVPIY